MLTKKQKTAAINKTKQHDTDTGSASAQVSVLSKKIEELAAHLKKNKKDKHSRRGLLKMVENRRKHLKYLKRTNSDTTKQFLKPWV